MVAEYSSGPFARRARQRAASTSNAVESAPPDTASRTRPECGNSEKRPSASRSEIAAPLSAAGALLFTLDALLHAQGSAGILAGDLPKRGAGGLLLAESGE